MKLIKRNARIACRRGQRERSVSRFGFTLVELLTVITIIGMLGAISITTVRAALTSAKETQTRTTIAKLDNILTGIYEKYPDRRISAEGNTPVERQRYRTLALRDLLRCDMPCSRYELTTNSVYNGKSTWSGVVCTPLQQAYMQIVASNSADSRLSDYVGDDEDDSNFSAYSHTANAELLYLVVMNAEPEARSLFSDREIADTDGNGLNEFVDGWGRPICWMRWAPGLTRSDRQPLAEDAAVDLENGEISYDSADPLDPLNLAADQARGWFLVPYVFSAGPDGMYGLTMPDSDEIQDMNNPFTGSSYSARSFGLAVSGGLNPEKDYDSSCPPPPGAPLWNPNTGKIVKSYKDNIDNHTLVR